MRTTPVVVLLAVLCGAAGCATTSPSSYFRNPFRSKNDDIERLFSLARLSERHGNHSEATAMYNRILEMDAQYQPALHRLGVTAARQGHFDEAVQYFERALQSKTKPSAELLADLGYLHYRRNELPAAEQRLREALQLDPYHVQAHNNLGLVLGEQRRYDEALEAFRKGGDDAKAYANLAYTQTQGGLLVEAEQNYHKALSIDPSLKHAAEALMQLEILRQRALQARAQLASQQEGTRDPSVRRAGDLDVSPAVRQATALAESMGVEVLDGREIAPRPRPEVRPAPERPAPAIPQVAAPPVTPESSSPARAPASPTMKPQPVLPPASLPTPVAPLTTVPISSTDMSQATGPTFAGAGRPPSGPSFSPPSFPQPLGTPR